MENFKVVEYGGLNYLQLRGVLLQMDGDNLSKDYLELKDLDSRPNIVSDYDMTLNPFSEGYQLYDFPLLDNGARVELVEVEAKLADFKKIITQSVMKRDVTFSNSIIITGPPGTGKTHNTRVWLNELMSYGLLENFDTISGKVTPKSLFGFLKHNSPNKVQILDDCDVFHNHESLNLLKAALDTRTDVSIARTVSYGTHGGFQSFDYEGFLIIITNEKFDNDPGSHLAAVLDRTHLIGLNLTPRDMYIMNASIIEKSLNESKVLSPTTKLLIAEFYNDEVQEWMNLDLFNKAKVNFSIRFILKIADLYNMFGATWKNYSHEYKKITIQKSLLLNQIKP